MKIVLGIILICSVVKICPLHADYYQYSDEKGIAHFTDDILNVPEAYRSTLKYHETFFKITNSNPQIPYSDFAKQNNQLLSKERQQTIYYMEEIVWYLERGLSLSEHKSLAIQYNEFNESLQLSWSDDKVLLEDSEAFVNELKTAQYNFAYFDFFLRAYSNHKFASWELEKKAQEEINSHRNKMQISWQNARSILHHLKAN